MNKKHVVSTILICHVCGARKELPPERCAYMIPDDEKKQRELTLFNAKQRYETNRSLEMHNCDGIKKNWGHY